ncbi:MAG: zinc ABC transporter substrate-binding protein [Bacteroidota bacterium]|nr:zinc ABC transporter substrate-binding protein [Bacteroidota bacterium]
MRKQIAIVLIFIISITLFSSCKNKTTPSNKPIVFVSILPQQYFVRRIAGDRYQTEVMIPPGMGHSDYDPTPMQMKELANAKIFFRIGYIVFEDVWMKTIAANNPGLAIVNTSIGTDIMKEEESVFDPGNKAISHQHNDSGIDPHIWLSPKEARIQAKHYLEAFIQLDPSGTKFYTQNYTAFIKDIDKLDSTLRTELAPLKGRKFMIYHPAMTYLARDYGLQQISIEFAGKEPTAAYLSKLVDVAKKEHIKVVFIQQQYDTKNAAAIANEIGARLVQFDHMAPDWLDNMYRLGETIKNEMKE